MESKVGPERNKRRELVEKLEVNIDEFLLPMAKKDHTASGFEKCLQEGRLRCLIQNIEFLGNQLLGYFAKNDQSHN